MEDSEARRKSEALLKSLRAGTSHHASFVKRLREELKQEVGLTLKDVNSSEEELEELRILGCKTTAQIHLNHLRLGSILYESHLKKLISETRKGKISLDLIGTSVEELEELRILGCAKSARKWLRILRDCSKCKTDQRILFRQKLHGELRAGKLLPEDIGTTNAELDFLVHRPQR